jgi:hypothetical protein
LTHVGKTKIAIEKKLIDGKTKGRYILIIKKMSSQMNSRKKAENQDSPGQVTKFGDFEFK